MSEVTIRPAREQDLPVVGELTFTAYHEDGHIAGGPDSYYAKQLANAHPRYQEAELLVAVDGADTILGTVTVAHPGSTWREIGRDDELEFRMLAVSPLARGKGIGEMLARHVLEEAARLGFTAVVLSSSQTMRAAHRLYERLGFHRTPDRDWSPLPGVPLITYRVAL